MEKPAIKSSLHERSKHRSRYDFKALIASCPALESYVAENKFGDESIDFADPLAVKTLNSALLQHFYQIKFWDIPEGYLCPPIPGRADYIHYAADLLASSNHQVIPTGKKIKVLDIGVGANCIYPIIGQHEYGWSFVGAEIDDIAVKSAQNIVSVNPSLQNVVEIRFQPAKNQIFKNIIHKEEKFALSICNPPFHASAAAANAGSERKVRNLGKNQYQKPVLNFGGHASELWTDGGEVGFISKMIEESKLFKEQCFWFTSLVSKSENLSSIYAMLKRAGVYETRTNEMTTGNKITRIVAWTFLDETQQQSFLK